MAVRDQRSYDTASEYAGAADLGASGEARTIRWPLVMGRYGVAPGEKRGNWQRAAGLITPMVVRVTAAGLRVAAVIG
jgi:hypothetical protein